MDTHYWHQATKGAKGGRDYEEWLQSDQAGRMIYKRTFNLQTHVDVRDIMVLDQFLRSLGWNPSSQSDLARTAIQLVVNTALESEGVEPPNSAEEALDYLERHGYSLGQFGRAGRQTRRIGATLQRESLLIDKGRLPSYIKDAPMMANSLKQPTRSMLDALPDPEEVLMGEVWERRKHAELVASGMDPDEAIPLTMKLSGEERIRSNKEQKEKQLLALEASKQAAIKQQDTRKEEKPLSEYEKKLFDKIKQLMASGFTSYEATQTAMKALEVEKKAHYEEMERMAPDTLDTIEMVIWLKEQGWSGVDAGPEADRLINKKRKDRLKAEKKAQEIPLEMVEKLIDAIEPEAFPEPEELSREELLRYAQEREEDEKKKLQAQKDFIMEMAKKKGQSNE
jgi:uncharacterized protein YoaH (UPF0181 family)